MNEIARVRAILANLPDDDPAAAANAVQTLDRELAKVEASFIPNGDGAEWGDAEPIPTGLPPVEPFSDLLLPESFRPWLSDVADRMQCPPDIPAVAAMVALGSVVGRRVGIRPKRHDDWTVVPNMWGMVVGRPGILKSPAVDEAFRAIRKLEVAAAEVHAEDVRLWEAGQVVASEAAKLQKERIKKALKNGASPSALAAELAAEGESDPPQRRRYLTSDPTVEALGELLAANPNGVLVYRDELVGWLRSLDREGHESARSFYLEAWAGTGRFTYDRIGRGTVDIEAAIVSVFGNIQPGPLREYLQGAASGGRADDGLLQRFQMAVWPDVSAEWRNVDRWPDSDARRTAFATFERLDSLAPDEVGAEADEFDQDAIPFLRFAPDAQEAFDGWRAELEHRVRSGDEHPAIESHLAKYRSFVPSLALVHHLADGGSGPVAEAALITAIAWSQYLESHARRMYATVTGLDHMPARALAKHLRAGDLHDGFTLRDVYRPQWAGLSTPEEARAATDLLEELGWIRPEEIKTGGRPKRVHRINPRLEVAK